MADKNRINSHFYQIATADVDDNVWGITADVANVHITGGATGQVLTTDGLGGLSWAVGGSGGAQQPLIEFPAPIAGGSQTFTDPLIATFLSAGYASVYINGVLLLSSEYDIVGSTLTVFTWLNVGDVVTVGATGAGGTGGGTGTVTSVATTEIDIDALGFTLTGGPITTTGTVTLNVPTQAALRTNLGLGNVAYINLDGNVSNTLHGDGTWSAGGAGIPGGSNTQIQFNNAGAFGGTANLTYDNSTGVTAIANLQLNDYQETTAASVNTGAAITPDFNAATIFKYTATASFTFNGFLNPVAGKNAVVIITQDGVGGRTMTSTMKFVGGVKTLSVAAGAIDVICVFYDGSTYYASLTKGYA